MTIQKNLGALNAEMLVGVCLTGRALLLELNSLIHERPEIKTEILAEVSIN
jgi:hypothetical protein